MSGWLRVERGEAPLIVSIPHAGTDLPGGAAFVSPWLARLDTDWWLSELYAFAAGLGATVVRTAVSRSVIDVNRDPSGASLYPGQATTGLCPATTFDGEPLYRDGHAPDDAEFARRRATYHAPYHAAIAAEIARLRTRHPAVVLYDAHSIRSRVPRLFAGELPVFNIGTNDGASCAPALTAAIEAVCDASGHSRVTNGRFKGGWITRHHGGPARGVHAVQMELAMRGYIDEPGKPTLDDWPTPYRPERAQPLRTVLERVLAAALAFASHHGATP